MNLSGLVTWWFDVHIWCSLKEADEEGKMAIKDEVEMGGDDLMLPTDLFGDDLFKNLMSG